ncbi:MAG: flotillin-like FloA family protein [Planctomycetaceae bacterium]|nr:flotillin-like FloA family protein [Planctomycetaceae bacterium]
MDSANLLYLMVGIMGIMLLVPIFLLGPLLGSKIACQLAGAQITLIQLVGMKLRRSPVKYLCELYIMASQAGLKIKLYQIESAYRAGADVELAIRAMIKASRIGQNLSWEEAEQKAMTDQYDDYVEDNYGDPE